MADLQDLGAIAADTAFQQRCFAALEQAAVNVAAESAQTANHFARAQFAEKVINGQVNMLEVAEAVLTNASIAAEATVASLPGCTAVPDSDIEFAVSSLFNDLAGVTT